MTPADVDATADAVLRSGWGDRRVKMAWVAGHSMCRPFVAEADGVVVGTGVTTVNGPVGWIGTIWIEPAWRGRGLGKALTVATIEAAESAGCSTLVLVATTAGQPLYERLGFRVQTRYRIVEAPGLASGVRDPRVRPYRESDLAAIAALDAVATGEDRAHLLPDFAAPATTLCVDRVNGSLGGFVIRAPWEAAPRSPRTSTTPSPSSTLGAWRRARSGAFGPAFSSRIRPVCSGCRPTAGSRHGRRLG
jgi:ribosomal protein S18 acetylase RimI-like enzyme